MSQTGSNSFGNVITSILQGVDNSIFGFVMSVAAAWFPQLAQLSAQDLNTIGNNFRAFLQAIGTGAPWGQALADMMTADWNAVEDSGKQLAIDFASDVATALETLGLLPQGK